MILLPETCAERILDLMAAHPALEGFTRRFEPRAGSVAEIVGEAPRSVKKGALVLVHANRAAEELGVSPGSAYTIIDDWQLGVLHGSKRAAMHLEALSAVDQCIRGVRVEGCAGSITYTEGWARVIDPDADAVNAFAVAFATNFDDVAETVGYVPTGFVYGVTDSATTMVTV